MSGSSKTDRGNEPAEALRLRRFKILADQWRLAVLKVLMNGPTPFTALRTSLDIEQSLLSHHLRILRDEGLVECDRDGKCMVYRLAAGVKCDRDAMELGCCKILLR